MNKETNDALVKILKAIDSELDNLSEKELNDVKRFIVDCIENTTSNTNEIITIAKNYINKYYKK